VTVRLRYENLVGAMMADPKHPERQELLEWLGELFYPNAFRAETLNRDLNA